MAQTKSKFSYSDRLSDSYITVKHNDRDLFLATHDVAKYFGIKQRIIVYRLPQGSEYNALVIKSGKEFHIYIKWMAFYGKTLVHEFIHIKQMIDGDLKVQGNKYYWKGHWHEGVDYWCRHHEKDAYKRARKHRRVTNL